MLQLFKITPFDDNVGLELISDSEHIEGNTYHTIESEIYYIFCEYLEEDCIILVLNCINSVFWWADKSILSQSPLSLQSLQWWQYWKLPIRPGFHWTQIYFYTTNCFWRGQCLISKNINICNKHCSMKTRIQFFHVEAWSNWRVYAKKT